MKAYSKVLMLVTALLAGAVVLFIVLTGSYRSHETDSVMVNDLTQTVREHWGAFDEMDTTGFPEELVIFNSADLIVYSTASNYLTGVDSAEAAVHQGCLCLTIADGSHYLGTAVIPDPDKAQYDLVRQRLSFAAIVTAALFLLAGAVYGWYVHKTIVVPFRKMEEFAAHVASGRLDTPVMLEQNNLFGAFTQSFDIMREELQASRSRELALKIKEKELVATLSHDLKTPLTGIKLLCELLAVKVSDVYVAGKISSIHQKAEQMDVLVSDLLASSLEDLGEMTVECCEEPSEILHDLVAEHDTQGLTKEEPIPECLLFADRQRLSQVIGNVISNSYKYAGTAIDISCRIRDSFLEMELQDHGEGVPQEELVLITNKFYRGKTNSAGKNGSGLGLYIASELMAKMNGELICSSRGEGFCVKLLIPLA